MRQRCELPDGHLLGGRADGDQSRGMRRLVRENREPAVDLERVDRDHLGLEARRDRLRDGALPGRRRPEDCDHLGRRELGPFSAFDPRAPVGRVPIGHVPAPRLRATDLLPAPRAYPGNADGWVT